jgi:translation elongation factor EF-1beta
VCGWEWLTSIHLFSPLSHQQTMPFKSLQELESFIATRSYVEGYAFSPADAKALSALSGIPCRTTFPNAYRWAIHIIALVGLANVTFNGSCTGVAAAKAAPAPAKAAPAPAKKAADDDFDDMFGDDEAKPAAAPAAKDDMDDIFNYGEGDEEETEEEKAANKARQERIALALKLKNEKDAKEGKVKKVKEKMVEKSLVVLEVKPWEADTDLEMVWREILKYQQEGLTWGENFKLEPVAYGIKKLVLTCTIVDSLVVLDDITENIEALEEYVQSVTIAAMNKI